MNTLFRYNRRTFASLYNYTSASNPRVFLEVSKGETSLGKMVFELYKNHVPKTTANFKAIATGKNEDGLSYVGAPFHRVTKGFMAEGGDILNQDGTGSTSIYGERFEDEDLSLRHYKRGQLTMLNSGENSNGSQFSITFNKANWLDGYHVVFGELVEGEDVLSQIEEAGSRSGETEDKIHISASGSA
ncbi:unnamed protein product [Moneuplotes crassus]|uniref:Peptidyl-prolyl cis-trans isomerase n=1 Tax=Euplotes crassus TaxID=5936 RepID=A0A7S3KJK3_EUPCR|nr:unnamed protein product [Moneuplotes crassus]|mmetsp:Transcript_30919/g.30466  ORF Transcript_30919/g.30466 Transcript_30919/m.30466 type:complete len:187 (+) Transcript_30919:2-562(+)